MVPVRWCPPFKNELRSRGGRFIIRPIYEYGRYWQPSGYELTDRETGAVTIHKKQRDAKRAAQEIENGVHQARTGPALDRHQV